MNDNTLEQIYTEGIFSRQLDRARGVGAATGALGRNIKQGIKNLGTGENTEGENLADVQHKAKLTSIVSRFQKEMDILFKGENWDEKYPELKKGVDFALLDAKQPSTPSATKKPSTPPSIPAPAPAPAPSPAPIPSPKDALKKGALVTGQGGKLGKNMKFIVVNPGDSKTKITVQQYSVKNKKPFGNTIVVPRNAINESVNTTEEVSNLEELYEMVLESARKS